MRTTRLIEITARSVPGLTRPFLCRGEDGWLYYVKGKGADEGVSPIPGAAGKSFLPHQTSQMSTPCFREAMASGRLGINSWATKPLKPVSTMAFITAG